MKIGYMFIGVWFGCCINMSLVCSEDEKTVKNIAALSLSASPSASFVPSSTPPIAISMVSPYREPFIEGGAELLCKLAKADKKKKLRQNGSQGIYERTSFEKDEVPLTFGKISIAQETVGEEKEQSLEMNHDSNDQELLFTMDDKE